MSNGRFTTSSVEILKRRHGITDVQLDCLIENPDMACLARHFGNIGLLVSRMGLLEADETEVRSATSISHQEATLKCLKLWKRQNPLQATFRALLSIVLSLGDGGTAEHICQYLGKEPEKDTMCTQQRSVSTSTTSSGIESSIHLPTCATFTCACNKCSILGHIDGRDVCSSSELPIITISSPDPPYPEDRVTRTTVSYSYFVKVLKKETDKIHGSFCDLLEDTFNTFQTKNFTKIKLYIFNRLTREEKFNSAPGLLECKNFNEVQAYLIINFCSWYNYELIMNLRKRFLSFEGGADNMASQYLRSFQRYVQRRCFLYLDNLGSLQQEIETVIVTCKLDRAEFERITHNELVEAKVAFIQIMDQIPEFAAPVKQVKEGCVEIVFRIPACFKNITSLTPTQIELLQSRGISDVTVGRNQLMKVSHNKVVTDDPGKGDEVKKKPRRTKVSTTNPADGVDLAIGEEGIAKEEPLTIGQVFKETVERFGEKDALRYKEGEKWKSVKYSEYYQMCVSAAKSFIKLGLEEYHGVCILGFNAKEYFVADLGAIFAGGLACGIYATNGPEACQCVAHDCKANVLVVENQKQLEKILQVRDQLPHLRAIVQYRGKLSQEYENTYDWEQFMELGKDIETSVIEDKIAAQRPNQCATLVYTSGTTGTPKGVMLSHDNVTWVSRSLKRHLLPSEFDQQHVMVSYLPLSHVSAQIADIFIPLCFGGLVYFAQPDALKGSLVITLREAQPTLFFGVPRVWEKFAAAIQTIGAQKTGIRKKITTIACRRSLLGFRKIQKKESVPWGFSLAIKILKRVKDGLGLGRCQVILTGAVSIHKDVLEFFMSVGIPILELYGMSENSGPHASNTGKNWRLCSVGFSIPGTKTRIDQPDENGTGEICIYGRHVFMGYLNNEEKTKETIDDEGWLHSGDIGRIDDEGYLFITGRIKELIITSGGENMAPVPVEDRIKEAVPFLSNVVMIGDKRKFVSCLVTLKCVMDPDTGEPTDNIDPVAISMIAELGSKCTRVSEVIQVKEQVIYDAIEVGLTKANEKAVSRAQKVQKFHLLECDFSIPGGELGPTLKLKRHVVTKKYAEQIELMYQ